ncbi:MAG: hypothetical protein R3B06_18285 [Kofleriaceae bacterium]
MSVDPSKPTERGVPAAVVVTDGKVPGDVPPRGDSGKRPSSRRDRRLANYLLDKRLQLRYVLLVTIVSAIIAATLGYLIYDLEHGASDKLRAGLAELAGTDASLVEYGDEFAADIAGRDRALVFQMIAIGLGITVILSGYLVAMTHKVAGPLYKVGIYLEQMAEGRLGPTTPLRKGDMLQDFYVQFQEAHGAVRARLHADTEAMATLVEAWTVELGSPDAAARAALAAHVEARRRALA